jgi:hypothetical protein
MATKAALFCLAAILVMGCGRGIVYTNTTKPYSKSFRNTPVGKKVVVINTQNMKATVPTITPPGLSAQWDTDEIIRLAREAGITKLRHIDIKTLSFLLGTYHRQTLIVYGD